ncbi:MAG: hypothetical protein IPM98_04880 [Lewinellaceae bacterium]|nr:hypothetical protein [Lewinellaceae bacterium]
MTELAQHLIEREKRERTGYLDLGNCGLTELPDLSEWLEMLIVSNWESVFRELCQPVEHSPNFPLSPTLSNTQT